MRDDYSDRPVRLSMGKVFGHDQHDSQPSNLRNWENNDAVFGHEQYDIVGIQINFNLESSGS